MSAEIIQFIPKPNPNRMTLEELDALAFQIMNDALDPMKMLIPTDDEDKAS